jgi:Response regulator containing a CheY-like receiver domain and an HTH DNA-binding domain
MIKNESTYTRFDTLRDIIEDDNRLLIVLNRFEISLGFGNGTVEKVCAENGVDADTFLAVINFIAGKRWNQYDISLMTLIGYLRRSHTRFIEYSLPNIKKTLIEGIHEAQTSEIAMVILQFYDKYIEEVKSHMEYEDTVIFAYVEGLLNGTITDGFKISDFASSHDHMAAKLDDLKELFIFKYKQKNNEMINTALLHLMLCGKDLIQHCEIENHLLFPQVERLEREVRKKQEEIKSTSEDEQEDSTESLTEREKEVLRWIAHGLSTKEIADKMCLSFHTVNSYRKNIGAKLNIHSVTGMAFYAVLHHIIDINEIEIP